MTSERRILSIGHSNHSLDRFLELLDDAGIEVVADVRSAPRSGYSPHFDQAPLRRALQEAGVQYVFLGRELGGRPRGSDFYDDEGHARYDLMARTTEFAQGLERLEQGADQFRVAMMCSEESPMDCHRRLLITRVLLERDTEVVHVRGDGSTISEQDLARLVEAEVEQQSFFDTEERPWRSIRPVSRSGQPGTSSEH